MRTLNTLVSGDSAHLAEVIDKTRYLKYRLHKETEIVVDSSSTTSYSVNLNGTHIIYQKAGHVAFKEAVYYSPVPVSTTALREFTVVSGVSRATKRASDAVLLLRAAKKIKLGSGCLHSTPKINTTKVDIVTGFPIETYLAIEGLKASTDSTSQWETLHRLVDRVEELEYIATDNISKAVDTVNTRNIKKIVASNVEPYFFNRFEKWCYMAEYCGQHPEDTTYIGKVFQQLKSNPVPENLYQTYQFENSSCPKILGKPSKTWGYF
jgi:hypothetical protein